MRSRPLSQAETVKAEVLRAEAIKAEALKVEAESNSAKTVPENPASKVHAKNLAEAAESDANTTFSSRSNDLPQTRQNRYGDLATNGPPPIALTSDQLPPRSGSSTARDAARRAVSSPLSPNGASPLGPNRAVVPQHQKQRSVSAHPRVIDVMSEVSSETDLSTSVSSPTKSVYSTASTGSIMERPRPKPPRELTLTMLMKHPRVAVSFLPFLNINSFLNVLGSDDQIRNFITGEMVGRWVLNEWGVTVDRERGRSWPGLTVWEGFRKCFDNNMIAEYSC
jgi:hypothetical protein